MATSAEFETETVLKIIKKSYEDSLSKLSEQQRNDLHKFKEILSKSKKVAVYHPFSEVPDKVLIKSVMKYLEQKLGPKHEIYSIQEDQFINECDQYLINPCETLRSCYKLSMALYYARLQDSTPNEDFIDEVLKDSERYNLLETAGVCQILTKTTNFICAKTFKYRVERKRKYSVIPCKLFRCI